MDLVQTVRKEGSRGGRADFKWEDVKNDAQRENYLGHSLMAPVGRWQQGRDLNWYAKGDEESKEAEAARIKEEKRKLKEAEEDAMLAAMGLPVPVRNNANLTPLGEKAHQADVKDSLDEKVKGEEDDDKAKRREKKERTTTAPPIADWQTLAKSKRESVFVKIPRDWLLPLSLTSQFTEKSSISVLDVPRTCGILTDKELDISENYDATDLVQMMAERKLSSVEVVTAFCKRAAIAQQCVSCLTEIMFEEAIARARECDEFLKREGRVMGPLHGLPISLKDSFNVRGVQATLGYISFISRPPSASNSALVDVLLELGAVFYVKTNLPQTMMTADSHNNIFGRTLNPCNLARTAGGSTGGEGALLAMKGSVLGCATDIAGSNRIPAICCGGSSLKPTAGRIPFAGGVAVGRLGSPGSIPVVIGPCGRSVRDYALFMKSVVSAQPYRFDENCLNVPWRIVQPSSSSSSSQQRLRFGMIRGCKERPLHPPIARALHTTATRLKAAGHEIVLLDDKIPDLYHTAMLAWKFFMLDPKKTPFQFIKESGEPMVPSLSTCMFPELKGWQTSLDELWDMNVEKAKIVKRFHQLVVGDVSGKEGGEEGLDAIVMPGYQGVAPRHDTYGLPIYTVVVNLLNWPSGILRVGQAEKEGDGAFKKEGVVYEPPYDADECEGLPTHVQVVGKSMMDEELVEIMKVVESVLKE
ncbi:amidase [Alternaria panax]|uniref:Amidase n=1 Tax=Alternaria panax TaxID=48097 RepID=A0AAD4II85_9PLEO|nr:amidase [Alternaria panax]